MTNDGNPKQSIKLLSNMVGQADEDIDLAKAALYISSQEYPDLDVDYYVGMLDALASEADQYIGQRQDLRSGIQLLSRYLFDVQKFRGNDGDYSDPLNSYLNEVLDRRTGIPITLSLVYMEVASRLGMVFEGIGLPGHFVIRTGPLEDELYVDAFNGGATLTRGDCERMVNDLFQGKIEFTEEHLRPYTKREFLVRLLNNLKNNYFNAEDYHRAIAAADMIAIIDPSLKRNLRDRAWFYYSLKLYRMAIKNLEAYVQVDPEADDAERIKQQIDALKSILRTLN